MNIHLTYKSYRFGGTGVCAGLSLVFGALVLSSCGAVSYGSKTGPVSLPSLKSPGPVKLDTRVSSTVSTPAIFDPGTLQVVNLSGPTYISKTGFIVAAQIVGNQSVIFERNKPLAAWSHTGTIPGAVDQLDFYSLNGGFALASGSYGQFSTALYSTANGGRSWSRVATKRFAQIHFFDTRNGVALMDPPAAIGIGGQIMLTTDGGHSWATGDPTSLPIFAFGPGNASFSFVSRNIGWLAFGSQPGAGNEEKTLLGTIDGGQSWKEISSFGSSLPISLTSAPASVGLPLGGYLEQIRFVTTLVGYLVLASGPHGAAFKTTDGGIHWNHTAQFLPSSNYRSTSITDLAPTTPYGGMAVTELGSLWNQASSGSPWTEIYPPYRAMSISERRGNIGIVTELGRVLSLGANSSAPPVTLGDFFGINTVGISLVQGGTVVLGNSAIESKQSGKGWKKRSLPPHWQVLDGHFASASVGLVVLGPRTQFIEATLDGGKSWTRIPTPFLPFALDPLSSTNWWVIGGVLGPSKPDSYNKKIFETSFNLYHTDNAGWSWNELKTTWGGTGGLSGVCFASDSIGYVWNQNTLFATTDGGVKFVGHQLPANQYLPGSSSLAVGSDGGAWLASDSYPIIETKDRGATWSPMG